MLPIIFFSTKYFGQAFLILALRGFELRSDKNSSKNSDASLWITIASLFIFGVCCFCAAWIAIIQNRFNYKQMLTLLQCFWLFYYKYYYQLLVYDSLLVYNWRETISFDFSKYNSASVLVPVTVILAFYWDGVYRV